MTRLSLVYSRGSRLLPFGRLSEAEFAQGTNRLTIERLKVRKNGTLSLSKGTCKVLSK